MRYLRKQVLNRRAPYDQRLYIDATDGVVMALSNNISLPKSSNTIVSPQEGMIRYNDGAYNAISNPNGGQVEVYQGTQWRALRFKEATGITKQPLGVGDAIEQYYGPLDPAPPSVLESGASWTGDNLIVIVGNVFQIYDKNYLIATNPPGKTPGKYLDFGTSPLGVPPVSAEVFVLHGFDK